jgi:flagellar hook protein FlgE
MAVGSFSAGLSGLNANGAYLSVIGNNLANINTIGFKSSAVSFQDLVSQSITGSSANPMQLGLGVTVGMVSPVFSQGAIENTRDATNVAIQGSGFFVVKGNAGQSYTRAGNFSFNADGKLVTTEGQSVQGWSTVDPTTGKIVTTAAVADIVVPPGVLRAPTATSSFKTIANLDAAAKVDDQFTTSVQLYDALGQSHVMTITYTNTGVGAWDMKFELPGAEVSGGAAGTPSSVATGSLTFDENGQLKTVTMGAGGAGGGTAPDIKAVTFDTPAWENGAAVNSLSWGLVNNGVASLSGYRSASATSSITQNGNGSGSIENISISSDGTILAAFGAGKTVAVGQLAMAAFNNPKGLVKLGSNRYGESEASGLANIGSAGTGGRGSLIGSALEQSNVDIAQEFTQMILAQRGYQANSKTITVSDELMVETLSLKR